MGLCSQRGPLFHDSVVWIYMPLSRHFFLNWNLWCLPPAQAGSLTIQRHIETSWKEHVVLIYTPRAEVQPDKPNCCVNTAWCGKGNQGQNERVCWVRDSSPWLTRTLGPSQVPVVSSPPPMQGDRDKFDSQAVKISWGGGKPIQYSVWRIVFIEELPWLQPKSCIPLKHQCICTQPGWLACTYAVKHLFIQKFEKSDCKPKW